MASWAAYTVIKELKKCFGAVAYFYCDFTSAETLESSAIIRSILAQLLLPKPGNSGLSALEKELRTTYFARRLLPTWNDIKPYLQRLSEIHGGVSIIIDGIDECSERNTEDLIPKLLELIKDRHYAIKVFFSSRPTERILALLRGVRTVSLEDELPLVKKDINAYLSAVFQELPGLSKDLKVEIREKMTEQPSFRLVHLQMQKIRKAVSKEKIRAILDELPVELYGEYRRTLLKVLGNSDEDRVQYTKKLLLWLMIAPRPLSLEELAEAMSFDEDSTFLPKEPPIANPRMLLDACGDFVVEKGSQRLIALAHFSEFFMSENLLQSEYAEFYVGRLDAEATLTRRTMKYLLLIELEQPFSYTPDSVKRRLESHSLLQYCAKYWTKHAYNAMTELDREVEACRSVRTNGVRFVRWVQRRIGARLPTVLARELPTYQLADSLLLPHSAHQENFLQMRYVVDSISPFVSTNMYTPDLCPVYYPVRCGLLRITERFIKANPQWLEVEMEGIGTPLLVAVENDDVDMIRLLVRDLGADVNKKCATRLWAEIAPLYYASYLGHAKAFDALMREGAQVNTRAKYGGDGEDTRGLGSPILHDACYWGRDEILRRLLEFPEVDKNETDNGGCTALFSAVEGRRLGAVKLLVEKEVDLTWKSNAGKTAIQVAIDLQNAEITQLLLHAIERTGVPFTASIAEHEVKWAKGHPWYHKLVQIVPVVSDTQQETPGSATRDVRLVYWVLRRRLDLPKQVSYRILDMAHQWIKSTARRESEIAVTKDSPIKPYLTVVVRGPVRRIAFRTASHDQGWAGELPELNGGYQGSFTFFEMSSYLGEKGKRSSVSSTAYEEQRRFLVQRNVRADRNSKVHFNDYDTRNSGMTKDMRNWFASLRPGDIIGLYPRAQYPGWCNNVKSAQIELWCAVE
ncbi:hypothetical protein Hte_003114 [Hypoxylon texense]